MLNKTGALRAIFIPLFCLLLAPALRAQLPDSSIDAGNATPEALAKAVVVYPYTFDHVDLKETIKFNADGTGVSNRWAFQWRAKSAHEVELWQVKKPGNKIIFRFNDDYSSYQGDDFGHVKHVIGHQIKTAGDNPQPAPAPASQATPPPQAQQPPPQSSGGGDGGTSPFGTRGQGPAIPVPPAQP